MACKLHKKHLLFLAIAALFSSALGCQEVKQEVPTNVVVRPVAELPSEPSDQAWKNAPEYVAKLIIQDMVEPRLLDASTETVRVRALSNGKEMALRLEWKDRTKDDLPGPAHFLDACAIQLPTDAQPTVPAPQMGEAGRPVHISYWNAGWQAIVDGRKDSLSELYPNAAIDHHPFEAESLKKDPAARKAMEARYAPARALENFMTGPRDSPVEDLLAEGPSTLTRAPDRVSRGKGVNSSAGWSVVITRPLPEGFDNQQTTQIAFAIWRGESREVGARKMRTAWILLVQEQKP